MISRKRKVGVWVLYIFTVFTILNFDYVDKQFDLFISKAQYLKDEIVLDIKVNMLYNELESKKTPSKFKREELE